MAYTYLIGWSNFNKFYYGVRFSKNCRPEDLWTSYFTSSKHVKSFANQYGDPDIIEIRKKFNDANKARLWEEKVLIKMKVLENDLWINKTNNKSIDPKCAAKGPKSQIGIKRSEETKKKLRGPKTDQHKLNMKIARKKLFESGYKNPNPALREDVKKKMSEIKKVAMKGSGNNMYGKKIYNNGIINRAYKLNEIPEGWVKGRHR
jgi:hypothetical protein